MSQLRERVPRPRISHIQRRRITVDYVGTFVPLSAVSVRIDCSRTGRHPSMTVTTNDTLPSGGDFQVDVAVVGAGLSGLVAAHRIQQYGLSTAVFEAQSRVGGRVHSAEVHGARVDLGGTFVGPSQDRIRDLADEMGVRRHPTYDTGSSLIRWRGRKRQYHGTIPPVGAGLADVARIQMRLDHLAQQVPCGAPHRAPRARQWDAESVGTWLQRNRATASTRDLIAIATRTTWGCEPEELSLLHALHYIHQAGGMSSMLDTRGGAQEEHFVEGPHEIALRLASGLDVHLDSPVREIRWTQDEAVVRTDSVRVRARCAIVAVPPAMRSRISFTPALPPRSLQMADRWPQGVLSKAYAIYESPFWRADGLSGQSLSDTGPVFITFDASSPSQQHGILLGFIGGQYAREWDGLDQEERRVRALSSFADLFGARALDAIGYIDHRWGAEQWLGGGPTAAPGPGAVVPYASAITDPVGSLLWAGTEAADRWTGYMDGAVRAGERAALQARALAETMGSSHQTGEDR